MAGKQKLLTPLKVLTRFCFDLSEQTNELWEGSVIPHKIKLNVVKVNMKEQFCYGDVRSLQDANEHKHTLPSTAVVSQHTQVLLLDFVVIAFCKYWHQIHFNRQ